MGARRWGAVLMMGLLALVGCTSTQEPVPEPEPEPTSAPVTTPGPTPEPDLRWPLTGLPMDQEETFPAVAVKIENSVQSRPQTGLGQADLVWEEMVEGGITRFNAVFHSGQPEVVGPIRSLRPMDAGIVAPLAAPQVISGGQDLFLGALRADGIQLISDDENHPGFFRDHQRRAPHNLYGTLADFLAQAEATAPPPEQFAHAERMADATAVRGGSAASSLRLGFPSAAPGWTWDETAGQWLRDERGEPAVTTDGERLSAHNVVVMRVQVVPSAGRDHAGNPVPETVMTGSGEALVATGGSVIEVGWSKVELGDPVQLRTADGGEVLLAPGVTWVELVPVERGSVTVES